MNPPRLDSTIVKAFNLIEYLAANEQPVGVSVIAQNFDWQKSNAHRLLTTLKSLGYVRQDPNSSRYELSLKTWELGMKVVGRSAIKRMAQPFMRALSQSSSENVSLSILMGTDVLYLDNILSRFPLRTTVSSGSRVPAIFTASGKALLAHHPDAKTIVKKILETHPKPDGMTLTKILGELKKIRDLGYATSISGWRKDVNSVAVAILNQSGISIASISINGPADRLPIDRLLEIAPEVMSAAAQISEIIGEG